MGALGHGVGFGGEIVMGVEVGVLGAHTLQQQSEAQRYLIPRLPLQ